MTVNTASPLILPFTLGTGAGAAMGQGTKPELWALLSYADMDDPEPTWVDVSADVKGTFGVSRGRDSDLSEFPAGTATLTLDNRAQAYDPTVHSYIRPMMRMWLFEQFNGATNSMFKGYVESIDQQWPDGGFSDAICVLNAADEFKVLATDSLPNMDPPRDTYADMVAFDNPTNYWRWSDNNLTSTEASQTTEFPTYHWTYDGFVWDTVTTNWTVQGFQDWTVAAGGGVAFISSYSGSPIVGDLQDLTAGVGGYLDMQSAGPFRIDANNIGVGDPMGGSKFTFETWFMKDGNPIANTDFVLGPESNVAASRTWSVKLNTTGTVSFSILDSGGTGRTVTTATALTNNTWYHLVGELDGANLRIFINGVQDASVGSGTGLIRPTNTTTGATMAILGVANVNNIYYDETACYLNVALPVARASAHYTAGAVRGFRGGNVLGLPHLRAAQVLDVSTSDAPRNLRTCTRGMQPVFQHGQDPLTELRKCALAELPNGMLFIARDGTITLLDAAHRTGVTRWNTTQMTFGDEGHAGEWPYQDLDVDYTDAWMVNEWSATRTGGTLVTSTDATSVSAYGKRTQTLSDLPLTVDADVSTITAALLAKYKDPMRRVLSLTLNMADPDVLDGVFQLDLCDRIRVIRSLPGGGWFDQTLYIQKIEVTGSDDQRPWAVRLGVSPL